MRAWDTAGGPGTVTDWSRFGHGLCVTGHYASDELDRPLTITVCIDWVSGPNGINRHQPAPLWGEFKSPLDTP